MTHKIETTLVTAGTCPEENFGAVNVPPYRCSTFAFKTVEEFKTGTFRYGRTKTPTTRAFETAIAELDGAEGSISTCSGYSAITLALLSVIRAGDHVLITDSSYLHTKSFCESVLKRINVEIEYFNPLIGHDIAKHIKKNTSAIFMEAPTSTTFITPDIGAIVEIAKAHKIKTIIDNTWATPLLLKPIQLGVDISLMSATKYICGHSDAMLGVVSANKETYQTVVTTATELGLCAGSEELYLGTRGLHTLSVRMERHEQNALKLAKFLQTRKEVQAVMHPALETCPGHDNWKKYIGRSNGTFGFVLKTKDEKEIEKFADALKLFYVGVSWGGYESLIISRDPDISAEGTPREDGTYIRFHVGLENIDDLIADVSQALDKLK